MYSRSQAVRTKDAMINLDMGSEEMVVAMGLQVEMDTLKEATFRSQEVGMEGILEVDMVQEISLFIIIRMA